MKDAGIFFGFFFIVIILAAVVGQGGKGIFETTSSSTPSYTETPSAAPEYVEPSYSSPGTTYTPGDVYEPAPELTPREVEEKVAAIYRELDQLEEELREARLREPASPHRNAVTLSSGSVYTEDADQEYLVLRANSANTSGVMISDWYLESYVTDEAASIPGGDRIIERWRSPVSEPIMLLPGESAYLITGDSPIDTSFRENICTGYLNEYETFYPYLNRSCPYPMDELRRYGDIDLDNDRCYDFVERLGTCVTPDEETYDRGEVGSVCSTFVENTFNYNDCVELHRYDPFFTRDGYWRIYLEERNELWRSEREIIRLMDEADRVIAVLEY